MSEIPLAPLKRLLMNAGADRVSDDAVEALRKAVEDYAVSVGEAATVLARHAGRKTIKAEDIRLATK